MTQVSSFVQAQFETKFKTLSYDEIICYLSDDETDYKFQSDVNIQMKLEDDSSSNEETDDVSAWKADVKFQFHGMRVFDSIPDSLSNSYFHIEIDNKKKFLYKQTACWLLTDSNINLSADRLTRVQQSSR